MRAIPLNFQTLYADLLQSAEPHAERGSISRRTVKGRAYLYVTSKDGARRNQRSLGPADDPDVVAHAARIRTVAMRDAARRTTVSAVKRARIPSPILALGRVIEVVAHEGLFERGVVLIGTAAYQTYAGILGYYLPGAAIMTNDADLLVASFVSGGAQKIDLEAVLKRANSSFTAQMSMGERLPKLFRADDGLQVDVLTKLGRGRRSPVLVEPLGCSAEALPFMEYLAEESMEAVVLYGTGILVRVPPPLRFAMHKLLVAQEHRGRFLAKKAKDLTQARDLMAVFAETDPPALEDAFRAVRRRGPTWRKAIDASMQEIDRLPR